MENGSTAESRKFKAGNHAGQVSHVRFFLVAVSLMTTLFLVNCGGDGGGSDDEIESAIFSEDAGGGNPASHWDTLNTTSGAFVSVALFEDGTGQVAFGNDAFARGAGAGVGTRTLYTLTWEDAGDATIEATIDTPTFTFELQDTDVAGDGQTFEATYSDAEGSMDFSFTKQNGTINL